MDLNKAMIIGRLTRDPEMRTTPQGTAVSSFSVATNFIWSDPQGQKQERVEYHNIVAWRKLAEICGQYLRKGGKVYIEGRLQTREWEGQDGNKRQRTEIVADNMIMLDSKGAQMGQAGVAPEATAPSQVAQTSQDKNAPATEDPKGKEEVSVEDIPF